MKHDSKKITSRKGVRTRSAQSRFSAPFAPLRLFETITLLLILLCGTVRAQTAQELFNPPAREYIHGNSSLASNLVSQALARFPDDEKLQKLKQLIEEQQQQQQQDQQQQDQQDSSDQDQQKDQQDQENEQQEQSDEQQSQDQQEPQESQQEPAQQAGEMSEEEAEQLLDAMKQNEKDQRTDLRPYLGRPVRVDKDW